MKVFTEIPFVNKRGNTVQGFYLNDYLVQNLDNYLIRGVLKGHDAIMLFTGLEGTGKSTFVQSVAHYCQLRFYQMAKKKCPPFNVNNIVFSGKDLMDAIDKAAVGTALVFDEAIMDMSSQDHSTEMQKILIKKFTLIRKKRLFIFLVIPSFFMLRKYFAIFRTRAMINCYCPDGITRGAFRFYSFVTKKKLYINGYKQMDMKAARPDFHGSFVDTYGYHVDPVAYEAKKDKAIKALTDEGKSETDKLKEQFEDVKLKMSIDIKKFKEKWKEKFKEKNAIFKEKLKEAKTASSSVQAKQISKLEKELLQMEKQYLVAQAWTYLYLKNQFEVANPGQNFQYSTFMVLLNKNSHYNFSKKRQSFSTELDKGLDLIKLGSL